jgi:hypothetical protein
MVNRRASRFAALLRDMSEAELLEEIERPQRLLLDHDVVRGKHIEIAYWPRGPVNVDARIVIVGITAGRQQMANAWVEMRRCLRAGQREAEAIASARTVGSFSGAMRPNLVAMLDSIGMNRLLGLQSTASLWHDDVELAEFASVLRWPVFVDGKNYRGSPSMLTTPILHERLMTGFGADAAELRKAVFVPLGPVVAEALEFVAEYARIDPNRMLTGLPHPSGANAERIAFFLGRKPQEALSTKVRPELLIAARNELEAKVAKLIRSAD